MSSPTDSENPNQPRQRRENAPPKGEAPSNPSPLLQKASRGSGALIVGALVLIGGVSLMATAGISTADRQAESNRRAALPLVETAIPQPSDGDYVITAPGRLRARQATDVVGEVAGKVVEIGENFVLGGRLKKGELLFRIDPTDYEANLAAAKARVASAKARLVQAELTYKRRSELVGTGAVSQAASDEATANLDAGRATLAEAEAQVRQAAQNLARTEVRSPFDALVVRESVSPDSYVSPGQVLATLLDSRTGELVAGLQPKDAGALARIMRAKSSVKARALPNPGSVGTATLEGRIDRFAPQVDSAARTAVVVAVFDGAFRPENEGAVFSDDFMTLEVHLQASQKAWRLPTGAVRRESYIWAVEDGKYVKHPVTVLARDRDGVLIATEEDLSKTEVAVTNLNNEVAGLKVDTRPMGTKQSATQPQGTDQ